jgi:hypothetical protein
MGNVERCRTTSDRDRWVVHEMRGDQRRLALPSRSSSTVEAGLVHLQRTAGNAAVSAWLQHRTGSVSRERDQSVSFATPQGIPKQASVGLFAQRKCACEQAGAGCGCGERGGATTTELTVQRVTDPDDLSGSPFASLAPGVKKVLPRLIDKGAKPTLAEALNELSNETIASIARVGSDIATNDPGLFDHIEKIKGGWITDNYGIGIVWKDIDAAKSYLLKSSPLKWCQDDPVSSLWYHGTTDTYRQIPDTAGDLAMHVSFDRNTADIHIDLHQPVDGKIPFTGYCSYQGKSLIEGHAKDVLGGAGARVLPIGRYANARGDINRLRDKVSGDSDKKARLDGAAADLDAISAKVTEYAAEGGQEGQQFAGDKAMAADDATMDRLKKAEAAIADVKKSTEKKRSWTGLIPVGGLLF